MLRKLMVAMLLLVSGPVFADSAATLATCVTDNTSGKQRKDLARWIFLAMAAHPDLAPYTTSEVGAVRGPTDRMVAELFVTLITQQCRNEASATFRERGTPGLQVAFEALGRIAMLELMSNADTSAAMSGFEKYLDNVKISEALQGK